MTEKNNIINNKNKKDEICQRFRLFYLYDLNITYLFIFLLSHDLTEDSGLW